MDYPALKQLTLDDLDHVGFAPLIAAGNDQGIADLWNQETDTPISVDSLPRDSFLTAIAPVAFALAGKDAAVQAKWDRMLGLVCAASIVKKSAWMSLAPVAMFDQLISQASSDAIFTRKGTRAEVALGEQITLTSSDISFALRGTR